MSRVIPQPTYGFSTGFRSIASPYACSDQLPVPAPPVQGDGTACRQAKEPLTSPSFGCEATGPYMSATCRWRIGKCRL